MKRWLILVVVAACGSNHPDHNSVDSNPGGGGDAHAANDSSSTGDGSTSSNFAARPICAGQAHTCAILSSGQVKCWGSNSYGQLGLGDINNRGDAPDEMGAVLPLVLLGTGRTAMELSCGAEHTCALLDDASVKCWGSNIYAQLGLGDSSNRGDNLNEMGDHLPALDLGPGLVPVQVVAGFLSTCVRFSNGGVKCWGTGQPGELGDGNQAVIGDQASEMGAALPFVDLGTGRTAKLLAGGVYEAEMCAILDNDQLKCWGDNAFGQLGLGNTNTYGNAPNEMGDDLPVVDLATLAVQDVATSGIQSCALVAPAKIRCWGGGSYGALGDGSTTNLGDGANEMGGNLGTVPLTGTPRLIGVGGNFACAATTTGVYCWGDNRYGALGTGSTADQGGAPGQIAALPPIAFGTTEEVEELAVGNNHVCALFADDSIRCWGYNGSGQLGNGGVAPVGITAGQMGSSLPVVSL